MLTGGDDDTNSTFAPFWIQPLAQRSLASREESSSSKSGSYQVVQKLITASPNRKLPDAEIETALEAFIAPNGDCLWRRVAVWSGPSSPQRIIHASFILPSDGNSGFEGDLFSTPIGSCSQPISALNRPPLVCWAGFPERPKHLLLCVLVNPATLSIWDVYPDSEDVYVSGEGHSVSLPFQCCAIHPLGESHGLLLQRQEDHEDLQLHSNSLALHNLLDSDEDEDFFLKMPAPKARMDEGGTASLHPSGTAQFASPRSALAPPEVSSLFSLRHPLEDVLPVVNFADGEAQSTLITDVFEKILYTGVLRWTDHSDDYLEKTLYEQPICVSYHMIRKRHAIWALHGAPVPTPAPPLWKRTRHWRSAKHWDDHAEMLDQDLEDMELLGVVPSTSPYAGPTRDEALADALGVRRTPRRSTDGATRGRAIEPRSRNRAEATSVNRTTYMQGAPSSFKEISYMDTDLSMSETPQLLNLRPLSNLHPNVALKSLYEEVNETSPATNIFLSSNLEASGLLILGLVKPSGCDTENPHTLELISMEPSLCDRIEEQEKKNELGTLSESLRHTLNVKVLATQKCMAAQPIQTAPVPLCHLPGERTIKSSSVQQLATDILVLKRHGTDKTRICLYREQTYISDCAMSDGSIKGEVADSFISDIQNPVSGRVDFVRNTGQVIGAPIRGNIRLQLSDALAEKALGAIENTMFRKSVNESNTWPLEFALKLRADCCRLIQALCVDDSGLRTLLSNNGFIVPETIFFCVLYNEVSGLKNRGSERNIAQNGGSAWESVLNSSFHVSFAADNSDTLFLGSSSEISFDQARESCKTIEMEALLRSVGSHVLSSLTHTLPVASEIFDTFHLLYEDLKLSPSSACADQMRSVGSALVRACYAAIPVYNDDPRSQQATKLSLFLNHYSRDFGSQRIERFKDDRFVDEETKSKISNIRITSFDAPPCILTWLDGMIRHSSTTRFYDIGDFSAINASCQKIRLVVRLFSSLFRLENDSLIERDHRVVSALCQEGFTDAQMIRDDMPVGAAIPLLEVLNRCRDDPHLATLEDWTALECALMGRQDLSENSGNSSMKTTRMFTNRTTPLRVSDRDNPTYADKDKDGLVPLELSSAVLFPDDNRIREAGRLLRSSRPCFLSVRRSVEVSDHDYERIKQGMLLLLCRRALALPIGRGMVTIGTFQPVAAEPLPVPELCLAGRIPPTNTNLALDMNECQTDFKIWPEFHNGVAAGLRLPLVGEIKEAISKITRTWIVYNRPATNSEAQSPSQQGNQAPSQPTINSHAHGGLLLALGLRGHLAELEMTDIYDYLTQGQVTLTTGVLIGMAANKRGTCDISVSKMLCLHLPSLIPQHFSAIDVASPVQTAAVAGAGLLFQGSSHRMMTEFLLNEIGRRPESDVALDREAYTLSCGIALGMVNICKGERIQAGQNAGGGEGLADLRISERLYRYVVGGTDEEEYHRIREANDRLNLPPHASSGENERCSCVFEGESINIDVTAAGATLALGLIFMKTGNTNISSAIALPDTHFLLEYVRPDFLGLRVVSRALISWDDVLPTKQWIQDQLPSVVRNAYKEMQAKIRKATDFGIISDNDEAAKVNDRGISPGAESTGQPTQDYDCQAVRQIYVHVIAGACLGMGLRFAGTADKSATAAILDRVVELQKLRDGNDPVSIAMRPAEQVLENCLGSCAIALGMVNAGTGDLEVLKLFKILRWRCDEQVRYGVHQAFGMAIGLLFLGGGSCTLGREPEDIAALVAAFFPRFPYSTTDNQYHLQALRHLYALAVKRRDLRFVDVDTGENVQIQFELEYKNNVSEPLRLTAPCLLWNIDRPVLCARTVSDSFYPVRFKWDESTWGRTFFVKRKIENARHSEGSIVEHPLSVSTGNFGGGGFGELFKSLSGNPYILSFAQYVCCDGDVSPRNNKTETGGFQGGFCFHLLHECFHGDPEVSLPVYLGLRASIAAISSSSSSASQFCWDFRLLRSYYEAKNLNHSSAASPMLNIEKIAHLTELVESAISASGGGTRCPQIFYEAST